MATSRPFAYNTGSPIDGTEQVGNLAIGYPTSGFESTGLQWWNGPDEDLGYVIGKPIASGNQPNPLNIPASVGFSRSNDLTDSSFISIANVIAGPSGPFVSASNAKTWLNANGYWTSYSGSAGATGFTVTLVESGSNVVMSASGSLNINDLTLVASATGPFGSGGIGINSATWLISSGGQYVDQYSGFTSTPSNFGSGGGAGASSITGDIIGVVYNGAPPYLLTVPVGYTTGTQLTSSQTFSSQSFASMGLVEGTYTYAWGSGPNADSINVVVGGTGSTGSTGSTGGTGASTGQYVLLNSYSPANSNGSITFPNSSDVASNNTNIVGLNPGNGIYINKFDLTSGDQSSVLDLLIGRNGTLTLTQGSNSVTYSFTSTAFNFTTSAPYANQYWWDNYHNNSQSPLGTVTVTSPASTNFNYVDPITITIT